MSLTVDMSIFFANIGKLFMRRCVYISSLVDLYIQHNGHIYPPR